MSFKQKRFTASELERIVKTFGFVFLDQKGSHRQYLNQVNVKITIPFHGSRIIHPKIVKNILKHCK